MKGFICTLCCNCEFFSLKAFCVQYSGKLGSEKPLVNLVNSSNCCQNVTLQFFLYNYWSTTQLSMLGKKWLVRTYMKVLQVEV